jgi:hypothetical protein
MLRWAPITILGLCVALAVGSAAHDGALRTEGPLRVRGGFGNVSLPVEPGRGHGWMAVGEMLLCTAYGDGVELRHVTVDGPHPPVATKVFLRTVPPGGHRAGYTLIGSMRGLPPDFGRPHGRETVGGGRWSAQVAGTRLSQRCADHEVPGRGYTELVVAFRAGPEGAEITQVRVDYEWDHHLDDVTVDGQAILCGTAVSEPDLCTPAG